MDKNRVKICTFDYKYKGKNVEALIFKPVADGKYPGLMLIPGYLGTAKTNMTLGIIYARFGFAGMSVGTPGVWENGAPARFSGRKYN